MVDWALIFKSWKKYWDGDSKENKKICFTCIKHNHKECPWCHKGSGLTGVIYMNSCSAYELNDGETTVSGNIDRNSQSEKLRTETDSKPILYAYMTPFQKNQYENELKHRASKMFTNPGDALIAFRELIKIKEEGKSK